MISGKVLRSLPLVQTFQGEGHELELTQDEVTLVVVDELLSLGNSSWL